MLRLDHAEGFNRHDGRPRAEFLRPPALYLAFGFARAWRQGRDLRGGIRLQGVDPLRPGAHLAIRSGRSDNPASRRHLSKLIAVGPVQSFTGRHTEGLGGFGTKGGRCRPDIEVSDPAAAHDRDFSA